MDYMVGLFVRHFFSVVAIKGGIGSPPAEQGLSEDVYKRQTIHNTAMDRTVQKCVEQPTVIKRMTAAASYIM